MYKPLRRALSALLLLAPVAAGGSEASELSIVVLEFELNDLAGISPTPDPEVQRTASIAPLLRDALSAKSGYRILGIDHVQQAEANRGFSYLFDHADEAAKLGQRAGADLIAVGQVHKPSFLFAYLRLHLVDVRTQTLVGNYVVEVKGEAGKATAKGVDRLAEQMDETVRTNQLPVH
jgi:Protein of unknown function (DUF2380)